MRENQLTRQDWVNTRAADERESAVHFTRVCGYNASAVRQQESTSEVTAGIDVQTFTCPCVPQPESKRFALLFVLFYPHCFHIFSFCSDDDQ